MTSPASPDQPSAGSAPARGSALRAGTIMAVLAILLSWIPILGPGIAGFVGGREAGDPGAAMTVALVPAILLALFVGFVLALFELPVLGAVAGIGIFLVMAVQLAPMLVGAFLGGSAST